MEEVGEGKMTNGSDCITTVFDQARNWTPGDHYTLKPLVRQYLLIVIHWAACSFRQCVTWFRAPRNIVSSSHYVVSENAPDLIIQMVKEEDIAWHAGVSKWKDYPTYGQWDSLNPCSIGIELGGPPSTLGQKEWPEHQIIRCASLCKDIARRHPEIKLVDHSRICPGKKIDVIAGTGYPEDVFPWKELLEMSGVEEA
jgi:N-acetyl-anhydromuramyl-L-alanine amidase AmpD